MSNDELTRGYAQWAIIIGLTIILFPIFSKKYNSLGKLSAFVLIPVWIIAAIIKGVEYLHYKNIYKLLSFDGFLNLLAETLPMVLLFGGITFYLKYRKIKKVTQSDQSNEVE